MKKMADFKDLTTFFFQEPDVNITLCINEKMQLPTVDEAKKMLKVAHEILTSKIKEGQSLEEIKQIFIKEIAEKGLKNGQVLWPIRVALSGAAFSPGALELINLLGKKKSMARIEKILEDV